MTLLDVSLLCSLVGVLCYRFGWAAGANRMAAALRGEPTGIRGWWVKRQARKMPAPTPDPQSEMQAMLERLGRQAQGPGEPPGSGQYL